ncbi:hypothetical protein [Serratia sp. UGAL515B_01]|uniref:hypothetical protein n=1 Tax=Serratia sp. UGAL515B_01 TaxID=2986763 RepID=UPI002955CBE3|nr:hypothetical protein [Serratia sp. UGAL515B_01]WON77766.1 hypothetical protein OK023_03490 [Serratia sp. UGAL515B_01]
MKSFTKRLFYGLQLRNASASSGFPHDCRLTIMQLTDVVGEPQKIERPRLPEFWLFSVLFQGVSPEPKQAGFPRMDFQAEPVQSLF